MKKKLLAVALAACMTFGTAAALPQAAFTDTYLTASASFEEGDFKFEIIADSETMVVRYIGSGGDVVIPKTAGGKTVTKIYSGTFHENESVTSVTVPDTITRIYDSAFDSCYNVKKITLPKTLTTIEFNTFGNCYSLESITIPEGVTSIGNVAFHDCYKLKTVTLPDSLKELGDVVFQNCSSLKSITIPKNITKINTATFVGCTSLESVTLPDGLKIIEDNAFYKCTSLKSINLPSGLEEIGSSAFYSCPAMKSVTIPEGLSALDDQAFGYKWDSIKKEIVKDEDFRIYGGINTLAEEYAQGEGFEFVARAAGKNRFATAAEISRSMRTKPSVVFLANGMNYADALAGVPIAKSMNAPILLTNTDTLPAETLAEIKRLGAKNVILLGGKDVISDKVVGTLKANGCNTDRIEGADRFETAVKIAKTFNPSPSDVFFVYGFNFADALSVGAAAGKMGAPIIYLRTDGTIDKATAAYLADLKKQGCVSNAYVIGGEKVISKDMMNKAGSALGVTPKRISGANRYETCTNVNKTFANLFKSKGVFIAKGFDFPDALAGGVLAASLEAPILLADKALQSTQKEYLKSKKPNLFYVLGGTNAVP
ncbi:MAG: leucine-rich repeat protein, partial [Ruminococcus sp.]|nr:leucine-rich repeat protein [Ruminococcus sp.]